MKEIIAIQHCESVHHTNGMIGSLTDWDLSENGIKQAHNIGLKLKEELQGNYKLYSSDLKRAYQTAEIVGNYLNLTPEIDTNLRERDLGEAVGKTVKWAKANSPKFTYDVDRKVFKDEQSVREHYNQLKLFLDKIIASDDDKIIFVSHGGSLSVFNTMFLNLEVEYMNKINMHTGAGTISKYIINDDDIRLIRALGDTRYRM